MSKPRKPRGDDVVGPPVASAVDSRQQQGLPVRAGDVLADVMMGIPSKHPDPVDIRDVTESELQPPADAPAFMRPWLDALFAGLRMYRRARLHGVPEEDAGTAGLAVGFARAVVGLAPAEFGAEGPQRARLTPAQLVEELGRLRAAPGPPTPIVDGVCDRCGFNWELESEADFPCPRLGCGGTVNPVPEVKP